MQRCSSGRVGIYCSSAWAQIEPEVVSRLVSTASVSGEEVWKSPTKKEKNYAGVVGKSFFSSAVETPPAVLNAKVFVSAETYAEDANSLANVVFGNIIRGRD